jgi:hypothetical protein
VRRSGRIASRQTRLVDLEDGRVGIGQHDLVARMRPLPTDTKIQVTTSW